jgi:hypothetical protein
MNHEEQQQQYALDELLHPEGKPWVYWDRKSISKWVSMFQEPSWYEYVQYRRKSTAPNWDEELSPREVAECNELPIGYEVAGDDGYVAILFCGAEIWNQNHGWLYEQKADNDIMNHFKKRRKQALATYGNTKDNPLSKRQQQAAEDLQEVTKRDHKPSKDEILRDEAIARFTEKATSKFNAGIQEHNPNGGNDLEDRATFADLEDEIIDLWYYVQGLKRRIHKT